nr:leucine-rich repeat protein [Lachnospiraceae bacterium]
MKPLKKAGAIILVTVLFLLSGCNLKSCGKDAETGTVDVKITGEHENVAVEDRKSEIAPENNIEPGINPGGVPSSETDSEIKKEPEAADEAETDMKSQNETGSETEAKTKTESETETKKGTEAEIKTESETETKTEIETKTETGSETETKEEGNRKTETETDRETINKSKDMARTELGFTDVYWSGPFGENIIGTMWKNPLTSGYAFSFEGSGDMWTIYEVRECINGSRSSGFKWEVLESGIEYVWFDEGITSIEDTTVFTGRKLAAPEIPSTVERIGDEAFYYYYPDEIVLPEGITSIGDCAFFNAKNLKGIKLPSTLVHLGADAFSVVSPDNLNEGFTEIIIPKSVKYVG